MEKSVSTHLTIETLPDILTAKHISEYLSLSRRRVYELFQLSHNAGGIACFCIGSSKRVDKKDFISWLEERKQCSNNCIERM